MRKPVRSGKGKAPRRPTLVRLDEDIYRAVKMRSAATGRSVSDQANTALRRDLREDEADLRIFRNRENQPTISYEVFLAGLKKRGVL